MALHHSMSHTNDGDDGDDDEGFMFVRSIRWQPPAGGGRGWNKKIGSEKIIRAAKRGGNKRARQGL